MILRVIIVSFRPDKSNIFAGIKYVLVWISQINGRNRFSLDGCRGEQTLNFPHALVRLSVNHSTVTVSREWVPSWMVYHFPPTNPSPTVKLLMEKIDFRFSQVSLPLPLPPPPPPTWQWTFLMDNLNFRICKDSLLPAPPENDNSHGELELQIQGQFWEP